MPEFNCEILTPYRRFYSGKAESITFVTHDGQVEVLANHESLVAPVRIGQLRLVVDGKARTAAVTEGFARVKAGKVDLFVDAAEWPEEIDRERAEKALGRATKRLATETLAWRVEASRSEPRRGRTTGSPSPGESLRHRPRRRYRLRPRPAFPRGGSRLAIISEMGRPRMPSLRLSRRARFDAADPPEDLR